MERAQGIGNSRIKEHEFMYKAEHSRIVTLDIQRGCDERLGSDAYGRSIRIIERGAEAREDHG